MIWLLGAGPGDPGLLTVKGRGLLARADIIVHDALVSEAILALARPGARLVPVGKRVRVGTGKPRTATSRDGAAPSQEKINRLLVDLARENPRSVIVRLKGGDPFLLGRGGEEAIYLAERGIRCAVVPGLSSALAVPAVAGIPVTHRGIASSVTILTGTGQEGPVDAERLEALVRLGGTIVVLMGASRAGILAQELQAGGLSPETPVAVLRWGTCPGEEFWTTTLEALPGRAATDPIMPPAVLVFGSAVGLRESVRGIRSPRVLVTLAGASGGDLVDELASQGAIAHLAPALNLENADVSLLDAALRNRQAWTDLILTSRRAASILAERLGELGLDGRALASWRITVIGRGTAKELWGALRLRPDAVADDPRAEGVREALGALSGRRFLQPRARDARDVLEHELGAALTVIPVYETAPADWSGPAARVAAGEFDSVVFGSAAAVRVVAPAVLALGSWPASTRCIALGAVTASALQEAGLEPVTATSPDPRDLAAAALG